MTSVIDRRTQSKNKGLTDRQRFLKRNRKHVKKAVDRAISNGNITDIGKGGTDVTVPKGDISEPTIHHGQGGISDRVLPGNKEFKAGDRFKRPQGGGGGGGAGEASNQGEGEDDFTFHISEDEVLNVIFEDLELPNMTKKGSFDSNKTKPRRAGFSSQGPHNKLDMARSKQKKMSRMFAAEGPYNEKILALLAEEQEILTKHDEEGYLDTLDHSKEYKPQKGETRSVKIRKLEGKISSLKDVFNSAVSGEDAARMETIEAEIGDLKKKKKSVPKWNESTDMKFRLHTQEPVPISKAVMFCVMDVSASMTQEHKDNAKLFYFLLNRFLERHYEQTDIVFIRHTTTAKEVNEEEFFYGKETGGTIVSSGLNKMQEIMEERYPEDEWNIYGAQASDGDNWGEDSNLCTQILPKILDKAQGYFYTEITPREPQSLWYEYETIAEKHSDKFWMAQVKDRRDIFPVFREFFKKKESMGNAPQTSASALKPSQP